MYKNNKIKAINIFFIQSDNQWKIVNFSLLFKNNELPIFDWSVWEGDIQTKYLPLSHGL